MRGSKLAIFEIHYVHFGVKKTALQRAPYMTDAAAWIIAAVESSIPANLLPAWGFLGLIMTTAENQGVQTSAGTAYLAQSDLSARADHGARVSPLLSAQGFTIAATQMHQFLWLASRSR